MSDRRRRDWLHSPNQSESPPLSSAGGSSSVVDDRLLVAALGLEGDVAIELALEDDGGLGTWRGDAVK